MLCVPLVRVSFLFDSFHVLEIVDLCLRIMSQITQNVLPHGAKTPSNPLKQHVAACLGCSGRSFPELPFGRHLRSKVDASQRRTGYTEGASQHASGAEHAGRTFLLRFT